MVNGSLRTVILQDCSYLFDLVYLLMGLGISVVFMRQKSVYVFAILARKPSAVTMIFPLQCMKLFLQFRKLALVIKQAFDIKVSESREGYKLGVVGHQVG